MGNFNLTIIDILTIGAIVIMWGYTTMEHTHQPTLLAILATLATAYKISELICRMGKN